MAWESDLRGVESARNIFKEDVHWSDIGCVVLFRPCENVATDAPSGFVEDPSSGVAGD